MGLGVLGISESWMKIWCPPDQMDNLSRGEMKEIPGKLHLPGPSLWTWSISCSPFAPGATFLNELPSSNTA